ncbi:helix-turn-helix domain-containing protein, partial [Laceyella tengchongensis]|nr:helix-turn-helix domain-containing protein [Laceyella tengchongensis]
MYRSGLLRTRSNRTGKRADNNLGITLTRTEKLNVTRSYYYDPTNTTTAARVRNARISQNMTIRELAKAAGLSDVAISDIENNKSKPTITTLRQISNVLNQPISLLGCFESLPENTLGQKIKKARLYHGLTKEKFASLLSVDVKSLRSWEKDIRKPLDKHLRVLHRRINPLILDRVYLKLAFSP